MSGGNGPFVGQPIAGADQQAQLAWCIQSLKTIQNFLNVSSAHTNAYDSGNAPTLTSRNVNDALNQLDTNDVANVAAVIALLAGKQPLDATLTTLSGKGFVGVVAAFPSTSVPTGWLALDGSNRSRTTYSALFTYLGTTFGVGDGSTTFGTPDVRGRSIFGYDSGNASARLTLSATGGISASTIGNTGGEQAHTPTFAEIFAHAHTTFGNILANTTNTGAANRITNLTLPAGGNNTGATDTAGSSTAHNTVPPGIVFQWCIFAGA